jgi:hypothetical protein
MDYTTTTESRPRVVAPTAKEKSAVQRAVTQLLDTLAPHKVVKRSDEIHGPIEQHRTPAGCILQARAAALSVSWFSDTRAQETLGELHINVWNGVVSRGGSSHRRPTKATIVSEKVVRPILIAGDACVWRTEDGKEFETPALAEHCTSLLEKQIKESASAV